MGTEGEELVQSGEDQDISTDVLKSAESCAPEESKSASLEPASASISELAGQDEIVGNGATASNVTGTSFSGPNIGSGVGGGEEGRIPSRAPDFEPPNACIQRIIRSVLPDNIQIQKGARAAFSRCAGIFIIYVTACANDYARGKKRTTINTGDVLAAMKELEFEELVEPLQEFLEAFKVEEEQKKKARVDRKPSSLGAATSFPTQKAVVEDNNSQLLSQETSVNDYVVDEESEGHEAMIADEVTVPTETQQLT